MDPLEQYVKKNAPPRADPLADYVSRHQETNSKPENDDSFGKAGLAALESYGNAATLGYLPHLQSIAAQLVPNKVDSDLKKQGFKIQGDKSSYVAERDANIARQEQQSKDFPTATKIGTGLGIVGSGLLIPAGKIVEGASLGAKAWQGAKTGAAIGAVMNPGDVEGKVSAMPMERLKNAGVGGTLGGAIPIVVDDAMWALGKGKDWFKRKAEEKAFRALGRGTPTKMQNMVDSGKNVEIGRELLDDGAIPILGTPKRIAERVEKLKEAAGEKVGNLVKGAGPAKIVDAEKLGIEILDSPELALMRKTPGMESTVAAIEKQVETLAKNGKISLEEAQALRQGIDKSINFNKAAPDMRGAQEGLYMQRTGIRDAMNEGINTLNPGAGKDALLTSNRKYGHMATASDILDKELARNQSNRAISLTDTLAGAAGAISGDTPEEKARNAILFSLLNKGGRTFGNSMQARSYDAIAKTLAKSHAALGLVQGNPGLASRLAAGLGQELNGGKQNYSIEKDILLEPKLLKLFKEDENLFKAIEDPQRRAIIKDAVKRLPSSE